MQTIGERLEEARKRKGVSLREAAEATKIRSDYLQKLEANKFDLGLSPIYLRGFLRGYALYLKLPADKLVNDFDDLDPDSPRAGRPVNREVYGRMEFGAAEAAPSRTEPPALPTATEAGHKPPAPRGPRLPPKNFNPRLAGDSASNRDSPVQLLALVGGGLLVIALAVWALSGFFGGKPKVPAPAPVAERTIPPDAPAVQPPVPANLAVITALDAVHVQVWVKNPDGKYGAVLLPDTLLARNETATVPKTGPIYIQATAAEKIQIDVTGERILPGTGKNAIKGNQAFELH